MAGKEYGMHLTSQFTVYNEVWQGPKSFWILMIQEVDDAPPKMNKNVLCIMLHHI